ncbi:hypothetical protein MTR_6g004330 [Medicago truncatula]|uniref:Uncharacterized protein n=1 Tax=Medicago truncatula TaxID=3880 RepID=A0A072U5X4_MEDTR|nr:hypothetical protein MTR_6g004330 [Medicago truncatula]
MAALANCFWESPLHKKQDQHEEQQHTPDAKMKNKTILSFSDSRFDFLDFKVYIQHFFFYGLDIFSGYVHEDYDGVDECDE